MDVDVDVDVAVDVDVDVDVNVYFGKQEVYSKTKTKSLTPKWSLSFIENYSYHA